MSENQLVKLCFKSLQSCFSTLVLHLSKPLSHHVTCGDWCGCSGECLANDGCQQTCRKSMMDEFRNQSSQMLMIVSQDDLERVVQKAIGKLLDQRENKSEVYLTAEETAKRLKVDRSTLWRWNKEGYLVSTKVGSKVRYKLSDVERIQKGKVYER